MKKFEIPTYYKSSFIAKIKEKRRVNDRRKKDFSPSIMDFGSLEIILARHFGFCYGVENAIEVSYRAVNENPNKKIYLLSQMIHNPIVNDDLLSRGIKFLSDTLGNRLIDWNSLEKDDIVIVPAFGASIEIVDELKGIGVDIQSYNTTCPFVEKVWTRSNSLGDTGHSVIIHGKYQHEETRATFSHSKQKAASVVVLDKAEAESLAKYITEDLPLSQFQKEFAGKCTDGFDPKKDLVKVGVVNQTTMLASETQEIADYFKNVMLENFGEENLKDHFADTKDTLCYATNDNQQATIGLMEVDADMVIVVGGYNSSNTTHLVEILEKKYPTYFISTEKEILSFNEIRHFDIHDKKLKTKKNFLPQGAKPKIIVTSGASCPDKIVEEVILKITDFFQEKREFDDVLNDILG